MAEIIIVTHGKMASGMVSSLSLFFNDLSKVHAIDAFVDESNVWKQIDDTINNFRGREQLILMSDFLGGSVNQRLISYVESNSIFLISGINLPLLLEIVSTNRASWTRHEIETIVEQAKETITFVDTALVQEETEDEFF